MEKPVMPFMCLLNVVDRAVVYEPICFHKKEKAMNFVGIDLHKKTIGVCVVSQKRSVPARHTFRRRQAERIRTHFATLDEFHAVIEAMAACSLTADRGVPLAARLPVPTRPPPCRCPLTVDR